MAIDIVLVNPLFIEKDPVEKKIMTPYFPLGLMYLASVLRDNGYEVELFDCTFRKDFDEFEDYMRNKKPKLVGITSLITIRRNAIIIADIAHRYGAKVIIGGPDPTALPERYLLYKGTNNTFPVDAVVFDEGEITMLELANFYLEKGDRPDNIREIAGLRIRDENGRIISTGHRELIKDLDAIPFPARDLVDMDDYRRAWKKAHGYWSLTIINSRGCPYHCSWCQKAVFGRKYRIRTPENSADEMKHIKEIYSPDFIRVVDDITGVQKNWVLRWSEEVLNRNAIIPFECLTRVNLVSEDMLKALKDMGCKKIYLGVESGSQKVLDAMEKGITIQQIYKASELCKKFGIKTYFFMMVGYPGEDIDDLKLTAKLLRETLPDEFSTTIAYPLPGTKFYEQVRDRLMFDSQEWMLDWDYTAENKLLFKREKYNTTFYRWVVRWLNREWKDAWFKAGKEANLLEKFRNKVELILSKAIVNLLAKVSNSNVIQFQPAEGR
ncbi:Radical SAM superfamily enzyme YgiQ, UPF0313 family [Candidatus Kryptonium thompsonii]|uniref:Radical SAM superfamily enzyme YgiQ, UPF0313 family n=2 Tax=Candidatus Kryptonium thompsonii TaxID=1633631 RepID=A0A0P1MJ59_9BACT|nr:radical SAM protein [Candidatus Kryptonium thompsoni]CUS93798.1 Radical SAM superfamily enzyme YgiQ, UPF0313 family [Candidatus Kryptonium thompsoni]CUS94273.1 Radical SAM superfamily enzyme YgiQ, UPF0313 family [Candidatus Kryptonium thompsoni]CUS95194.1 Radical SAM superfamily enzyme YgiQ, UPF0313 family [Candidatus Kryptonium thompsoni]CUS98886.1 Radical SAM superfamily enzyme YgiQ, UPF0313 family [Candidatus Kryptonium thompsoni]CUU02467.1 Radical SAM superfamily enzyme YgiQ, UPF0313 fa